jgi:hypothetical protein
VTFQAIIKGFTAAALSPITGAFNALTATIFMLAVEDAKASLGTTVSVPLISTVTVVPLLATASSTPSNEASMGVILAAGALLFITAVAGFVGGQGLTVFQKFRPFLAEVDFGSDLLFLEHLHHVNKELFWASAGFLVISMILNIIFVGCAIFGGASHLDRDAITKGPLSMFYYFICVLAITRPNPNPNPNFGVTTFMTSSLI